MPIDEHIVTEHSRVLYITLSLYQYNVETLFIYTLVSVHNKVPAVWRKRFHGSFGSSQPLKRVCPSMYFEISNYKNAPPRQSSMPQILVLV